jgi:hypothetical protein
MGDVADAGGMHVVGHRNLITCGQNHILPLVEPAAD